MLPSHSLSFGERKLVWRKDWSNPYFKQASGPILFSNKFLFAVSESECESNNTYNEHNVGLVWAPELNRLVVVLKPQMVNISIPRMLATNILKSIMAKRWFQTWHLSYKVLIDHSNPPMTQETPNLLIHISMRRERPVSYLCLSEIDDDSC